MTYSIDELSKLTGLSIRTIRFYIQQGLVDRPEGQTRTSHYLDQHLEQLLRIKRLTAQGLSLQRVKKLLKEEASEPEEVEPGAVSVKSHVQICRGVELVVDARDAKLSIEQIRELVSNISCMVSSLKSKSAKPKDTD